MSGRGASTPDRVDRATLDKLLLDLGFQRLDELVQLFLADAATSAGRIADAADSAQLARHAHRLKSSSALLGAVALAEACGEIERLARDGSSAEARARAAELPGAVLGTCRDLATVVRGLAPATSPGS